MKKDKVDFLKPKRKKVLEVQSNLEIQVQIYCTLEENINLGYFQIPDKTVNLEDISMVENFVLLVRNFVQLLTSYSITLFYILGAGLCWGEVFYLLHSQKVILIKKVATRDEDFKVLIVVTKKNNFGNSDWVEKRNSTVVLTNLNENIIIEADTGGQGLIVSLIGNVRKGVRFDVDFRNTNKEGEVWTSDTW